MKQCFTCKEHKPVTEYHRFKRYADGRWYDCRDCYRKKRGPEKWRPRKLKRDPQKQSAQAKVRDAVRRGIILKPTACQTCGDTFEAKKLHGHHQFGYLNTLDVLWLCHKCHMAEHRKAIA